MKQAIMKRTMCLSIWLMALSIASIGFSQQPTTPGDTWDQQVQEQYTKHDVKIRHLLPPYSGMPLVLDLFHKHLEDGMCDPEQHVAWETQFSGIMSGHGIVADLGFSEPAGATATSLTTIDTFAPIYSLPAKRSSTVVIAKPIAGRVCIPQSRRYVYTKFTLEVLKEYKKHGKKREPHLDGQVTAVDFGGTVRFPSEFLETFVLDQRGFVEIGRQYLLFMWKPVPSDDTLVISQGYVIQDGLVFPVSSDGDGQQGYTKMPFAEFEAKVKAAIARNVDADAFPGVHAASHQVEGIKKR